MKHHLKEAVNIISANFRFVLILAITSIFIKTGGSTDLIVVVAMLLNFLIIWPAAYGRLTETVIGGQKKRPYIELFQDHWANYFVVVSLIILLPIAMSFIFMGEPKSLLTYEVKKTVVPAIVNVVTVFAMPYVFLEHQGMSAISKGMRFLYKNLNYSIPLIILIVMIFLIKELVAFTIYFYPVRNVYILLGIAFLNNILTTFIHLVIFVAACKVIVERRMSIEIQTSHANQSL